MPKVITLLSGATASTGPSSLTSSTLGVALPYLCDQAIILVHSTAGSGVMTAVVRLWGFNTELGRWYDLGPLNGGNAIAETTVADSIAYAEGIAGLRPFSRLYAEIVGALGGTATAVTVAAACVPANTISMA